MSKDKKQEARNKKQEELQQQIAELTQALQRERADAENIRRRAGQDQAKMAGYYKVLIIRDLLPALDNLDRAISHKPKDSRLETRDSGLMKKWQDWVAGVESTKKQLEQIFQQLGVERIRTVGEIFDPHLHEAVHHEDGKGNVEVVCEELQPGYKLGDEIIRHARVKVKKEKK